MHSLINEKFTADLVGIVENADVFMQEMLRLRMRLKHCSLRWRRGGGLPIAKCESLVRCLSFAKWERFHNEPVCSEYAKLELIHVVRF